MGYATFNDVTDTELEVLQFAYANELNLKLPIPAYISRITSMTITRDTPLDITTFGDMHRRWLSSSDGTAVRLEFLTIPF